MSPTRPVHAEPLNPQTIPIVRDATTRGRRPIPGSIRKNMTLYTSVKKDAAMAQDLRPLWSV